jgi:hypothetical protein
MRLFCILVALGYNLIPKQRILSLAFAHELLLPWGMLFLAGMFHSLLAFPALILAIRLTIDFLKRLYDST